VLLQIIADEICTGYRSDRRVFGDRDETGRNPLLITHILVVVQVVVQPPFILGILRSYEVVSVLVLWAFWWTGVEQAA
jgi:hypothetical protein